MKHLLDNIWLKILALIMGFLVWFHVATEKVYNYEVRLPVTRIELADDMTLASPPPDSVLVGVTAKGKLLVQNAWRRSGVRINVSKLRQGHHLVVLSPENVLLPSTRKNVAVDEVISPSQIDMDIDARGSATLPVTPNIIATPDDGYAVMRTIDVVPSQVVLIGPRSVVRSLKTLLTERRELTGLRNNVTIRVGVQTPPGYAMRVDPDTVMLHINVVPVKTRVYDNLPVVVYNVPAGYSPRINPPTVQVELAGPPEDIELLNKNALTVAADYRQVTPTGLAAIKVECPPSFHVKRASADSVRIIVTRNARSRY